MSDDWRARYEALCERIASLADTAERAHGVGFCLTPDDVRDLLRKRTCNEAHPECDQACVPPDQH